MASYHQNKTHVFYGQAMAEYNKPPSEQKLWRAVLNQALEDAFGVNTISICSTDKAEVDQFFRRRTSDFDRLCEDAGLDPTRLWRKIQKLKGVQAGFLTPNKKEQDTLAMFDSFKERRNKYIKAHWRNNYVG